MVVPDLKLKVSVDIGEISKLSDSVKRENEKIRAEGQRAAAAELKAYDSLRAQREKAFTDLYAMQRRSIAQEDALQEKQKAQREKVERERIALQRNSLALAEAQQAREQQKSLQNTKYLADSALRIERQAAIAESSLVLDKFDRRIAIERAKHTQILSDLKGNDAAQEAEIRRHNAVVSRIQMDKANLPNTPFQQLLAGVQQGVGFQNGVAGLATMAGGALGAAFAFSKLTEFIGTAMDSAVQMQGIRQGLDFVSGSAQEGAKQFDFLRNETQRLGISFKDTAPDFTLLAAAARGTKMEGKGVQDLFRGISEANVTLHLTSQQTAGAINAFQQMLSKGKVQAQEMNLQLGNALPGSLEIASRAMGVTKSEFVKMMSEGKIIADEFLPKMAEELHKTFGEAAVTASGQARAEIQKFKNSMNETSSVIGDVFLEAAGKAAKAYLLIADSVSKAAKAQNDYYVAQSASLNRDPGQDRLNKAMEEGLRLAREAKAQEDQKNASPSADQDAASKEMAKEDKEAKRIGLELTKEYNQAIARENTDARGRELALAEAKYQENLERAGAYYDNQQIALKIYRASVAGINAKFDQEEKDALIQKLRDQEKAAQKHLEDSNLAARSELERIQKETGGLKVKDKQSDSASRSAALDQEKKEFKDVLAEKYKDTEYYNDLINASDALFAQKHLALNEELKRADAEMFAAKMGYAEQYGQSLSNLIGVIGGKSKVAFELEKAIALGEIALKTAVAVVTDNSNPLTLWKVPYDIALGASEGAVVAAQAIKGFATGGYTGAGNPMDVAGLVHRDEYVIDHSTLARAGGPKGVERALNGGGGVTHNGNVVIQINVPAGTTPAQARDLGAAAHDGYVAKLREWKRMEKDAAYYGVVAA